VVPFGFRAPAPNQPAHVQGIPEKAADGIRTHDLLHGKRAGPLASAAPEPVDLQEIFRWRDRRSPPSIRADVRRYVAFRALLARSARNRVTRF
jgi:hypothetical protein